MNDANSTRIVFWGAIAFSCLLVIPLLAGLHQLWVTVRLYRRTPLADALGTLRCTARTRNAWMILLPPVLTVIVFGIIAPARGITYPNIFFLPIALIHFLLLVTFAAPPSVLLLGSSRWESVRLFNLIERGIYPYRVVVLFEPSRSDPNRHSRFHWLGFEFDNLRILGRHSWRDVVYRIASNVPIIVLDTRLPSPAVIEESRRMLEARFLHKTLFVVADDGSAPSLTVASPDQHMEALRRTTIHDVVQNLKVMGLAHTTSPDDDLLLSSVSYARNAKRLQRGMVTVGRTCVPFDAALKIAEQTHGEVPFVIAARELQAMLRGRPGDGALEVYEQLPRDISATEQFLANWGETDSEQFREVISTARLVCQALCDLQREVDHVPPSFLIRNRDDIVERRRQQNDSK